VVVLNRLLGLALLPALLVAPSQADSLTSGQFGAIFCMSRLSGDMAPALAILTPELTDLVGKADPAQVRWQGKPDYAAMCQPVGAAGTAERPEIILSYQYREPDKANFSDRLVTVFVDGRLRLDDILFADKTSLRDSLR